MILLNAAYVPYYFNNDKILSITMDYKENDVQIIEVYMENGLKHTVFCNEKAARENWVKIVEWDKYRYGIAPETPLRDFGSGIDGNSSEEMHHNQTIYTELVPNDREPDGETAGRVE